MAKFRKKPVVIEAWHWLMSSDQDPEPAWFQDALVRWPLAGGISHEPDHPDGPCLSIATLEGVMVAKPGDYIVQGVKGELYPCKPGIFEVVYEAVTE